jgi:hypothetical protein
VSAARPECPRHPDSKVLFDGRYGVPGQRRQRYRCVPADGSLWHRFTEPLPRLHGGTGECLECERGFHKHEGPPTGRRFQFSTRQIAEALMMVGRGQSDARVGETLRRESGRNAYPKTPSGRWRGWNDGSTIRDWMELFVEPIYETHRPKRWPRIIAIDDQPFDVATEWEETGRPKAGGTNAFHVFGIYGWDSVHEPGQVLTLRAAPRYEFNQGYPYWVEFLRDLDAQLEGRPLQIVCDNERGLLRAVHHVWPRGQLDSPTIIICHWHLRNRLQRRLNQDSVAWPDDLRDQLKHFSHPECPCAFCTLAGWTRFEAAVRARTDVPMTLRWIETNAGLVRWQLQHKKGFRIRVSTGGLENVLKRVSQAFEMRRGQLTNRHRLDLRLKLMELEMRNQASASHYAKVIREELLKNAGYGTPRNLHDDQGEHPSLRPPLKVGRDKTRAEKRAEALAQALADPEPDIPF